METDLKTELEQVQRMDINDLKIELTDSPKCKPTGELKFGRIFTDHMFEMDFDAGIGWHDAKILPYHDFSCSPAMNVFHYGQCIFEGLKAYKNSNGEIALFRPRLNFARMNDSAFRLGMPNFDADFMLQALTKLVRIEKDWIPTGEGTSLYIRPTMIATEVGLGVHTPTKFKLFIICSPVGAYYKNGLKPVSLKVETKYVRACIGGTGHHKVGGNYAASILAADIATKEGYDQVMWLDAHDKKYVEEVGSMNIFFCFGDTVVTPALAGSILPGVTRRSTLEFLTAQGYKVQERAISIDEIAEGLDKGTLTEVFGTGTAAVISPVGRIGYCGKDYTVGGGLMGHISKLVYDTLTGIQTGKTVDKFDWRMII